MSDVTSVEKPRVVVMGGSLSSHSRADRIAGWCARDFAGRGAATTLFRGTDLAFPFYEPGAAARDPKSRVFVSALAAADGAVFVSPAYHGTVSGLLKNAIDYLNELADEPMPFLDGRAVGCVAVAAGGQGAAGTLVTLRTISHALRAWPTPLGVALSGPTAEIDPAGQPADAHTRAQLRVMTGQVLALAQGGMRRVVAASGPSCEERLPAFQVADQAGQ